LAAPNTAWLAQRRLVLAMKMPQQSQAISDITDSDTARLMRLGQTRVWLAQIYTAHPLMRDIITRNESKFRAQDAQQFLQALRREMNRVQKGGKS
jgi:hypothetical protein